MGRSSGGWTGSYRITGPFLQRTPVHGGTRWLKPDFPGRVRVPGARYMPAYRTCKTKGPVSCRNRPHADETDGAPIGIRTPNLLIRSHELFPICSPLATFGHVCNSLSCKVLGQDIPFSCGSRQSCVFWLCVSNSVSTDAKERTRC